MTVDLREMLEACASKWQDIGMAAVQACIDAGGDEMAQEAAYVKATEAQYAYEEVIAEIYGVER